MWTILVVDDEPFVRVAMASLQDWTTLGYDFRYEAGNGQQALDLLGAHPEIDVVLLDLSMPVLDGIQFLKALPDVIRGRGDPGRSPGVIVLSAHDDFSLVRTAFQMGVQDYLLKTEVDEITLEAILRKVTAGLKAQESSSAEVTSPRSVSVPPDLALVHWLIGDSEEFQEAGPTGLTFPITLWSVEIADFESLVARLKAEELPRFLDLFLRSIRQWLDRRGGGRAVPVDRHSVAVFTVPVLDEELLTKELKETLERYLSVRIEIRRRPGVTSDADLRPAWEALSRARLGASRIVVMTKRYLREHFTRPAIPLDELAAHVGVSRNHLSWEFTRETGETITDHLARLRVEEACRLLATTTWKVYEIAEKVGYTNVEHFSRVFKKVTGTSPNRWAGDDGPRVFRDIGQ